ncbi:MAG: DNA polymerase III subunit delta [Bacillota bacterium]
MKYYLEFIKELQAGRIFPVYLFFGPETYLRSEAIKKIRDSLLPGGQDEFNLVIVDGEETPMREVISLASMTPLFSGMRLVLVKNATVFSGKRGAGMPADAGAGGKISGDESLLLKYLDSPNPDACLIFDAGENTDKRRKIYKEIAKRGRVVEFTLLRADDLKKWLNKQAGLSGKALSPGAASEILRRAGNSLQNLSVEIKKLIDYTEENSIITEADVAEVTPSHPEEDIFAVMDAIGEKKAARAIEGIERLLLQKHPPTVIMSMIVRQIRLLLRVGNALRSGKSYGELPSLLGLHPFVAKKIASQQKNFNQELLINTLIRLQELDTAVKSGKREFLSGIGLIVMDICRRPSGPIR